MKYINIANFEEGISNERTLKKKKRNIVKKAIVTGAVGYAAARGGKGVAKSLRKRKDVLGKGSRAYLKGYKGIKKGLSKGANAAGKAAGPFTKKAKKIYRENKNK